MFNSEDQSQLIDEIYGAAFDADRWPRVLGRLSDLFGSSSAHLSIDNFESTQGKLVSFGTDANFARGYADYYAARNVLWQRIVQHSLKGILTDRMIMPREEFRRSEFYNEFLRAEGGDEILGCMDLQQMNPTTNLILWRPERFGSWQRKDIRMLGQFAPHLRRALRVNQDIGELRFVHDLAIDALHRLDHGIILVNGRAQVCFANHAAETIMADAAALRIKLGELLARRPSDTTALHRLIAEAALNGVGGSLAIAREERPALHIAVVPRRAEGSWPLPQPGGAAVFIKDPERPLKPSLTAFARHFGLTPAQTALAQELIRGDGLNPAAARLGVSHATVRTHLIQIFQKTGTCRQTELIRVMLQWSNGPAVSASGDEDTGALKPSRADRRGKAPANISLTLKTVAASLAAPAAAPAPS